MTLPIPDATAIAHSKALTDFIRQDIIKSGGSITFARFMEKVLYEPGLGYYSAGAHKLGKGGDFVTAPEISPLFAQCVARQIQEVLIKLGTGDILEIGAGSGTFAKDLLRELKILGNLPENYYILEISADLRERQKKLLKQHCPEFLKHVIWLDSLPEEFVGVIFANEVMDAMPVNCFEISRGITERSVTWQSNQFSWILTQPSSELVERVQLIQDILPEGYQSEANLMLPTWIQSLGNSLKKGLILLLDYGYGRNEYYHPQRTHGTLKCFYQQHHHNNPFVYIGLQDITAHVDFTTVAESAITGNLKGLSVKGFTTQAGFLLACGLLEIAEKNQVDTVTQYHQAQAIKTLTLPSEMGELIKAIALTKGLDTPLLGFSLQDRRRDL